MVGAPLSWIVSRLARLSRSLHLGILNVATNFSGIGLGFAYVAALGAFGMVTLALKRVGLDAAPPPQADFVQYAGARRIDRIAQEQALVDMVLRGPETPDQPSLGGLAGSMFSGEMLRAFTQANNGRGG